MELLKIRELGEIGVFYILPREGINIKLVVLKILEERSFRLDKLVLYIYIYILIREYK